MPTSLTVSERARLNALEAAIESGFQQIYAGWQIVGPALEEINRLRLYRDSCDTFEEYVASRFGLARRTAYEWIEAAGIVRNFAQIEPPRRVAHAIEIARLPATEQAQAMQEARALAGREPTTHQVRVVVCRRLDVTPPQDPLVSAEDRRQRNVCEHIKRMWLQLDDEHRATLIRELSTGEDGISMPEGR